MVRQLPHALAVLAWRIALATAMLWLPAAGVLAQTSGVSETPLQAQAGGEPQDPFAGLTRDEAAEKLEATKQELESSRAQEEGLTQNVEELAKERARLNEALIEAGQRVQAAEAKLSTTEAKLKDLNGKVEAIRGSITERKRTIVKMLSAMQRIGRSPPPALVTPREDSLAAVRSAMLLAKVFPKLKYQADTLSKELDGLVALEDGIRKERDAEQEETDRLASERNRLDALLEEKRQKLAQSQVALVEVKRQAEQQAQQVGTLGDLIAQLDKQIASAEVAQYDAEIAAEQALRARRQGELMEDENLVELKPESTKVAFANPSRMKPAVPFADAKGSLPLPAQGKRLADFGDSDALGGTRQGISLETRENARVTAPADGWVVYAGPFRSYGQLLIVNAGGGYHILLAGMDRIDVSVGQFVLAGEPIAEMGAPETGGEDPDAGQRPALYVEFRKDGRPIDPDPWWAELSDKVQG
ncbi:peptidoglycan DD-metalloendopeptidase family protein [Methyloligella sp. 2.7D]|uniref:murein hydrolase activator EnvC family protein n=1 Tax=unclassified Methyloligella TaxID=2625955 RepID=UPI00157C9703|nr:peptidoglycan DD-metalloendopeptidase family protein [Methyloligella sp. GL2]QKP76364.1 peptidoglycan DD-metalloendopeptidase family protein [Methyloligella sp. GL2]